MQSKTTAGAAGAGAAVGGLIAWGLGLALGVDVPPEQTAGLCTIGAFAFGRIFPR